METKETNIFQRLLKGELVPLTDADYAKIGDACNNTRKLLVRLNNEEDPDEIRRLLSQITGFEVEVTTTVFPPFQINYGKNTKIGKNVFINFDCTFLDLGGITIDDDVLVAPKVSLLTEGHPTSPENRHSLVAKPIHIKRNAWIGASATVLPGVTVGENSIVAAGSVVSQDVPDNSIVAGVPAKIIKSIENEKL